jgi:hypothetical protein
VLPFIEGYKTAVKTAVFRQASDRPKLSVQLLLNRNGGSPNVADGVVAVFDESFKNSIGDEDSYKFTNLDENLAIDRNGTALSIEGRPIINGNDTLPLKMWAFRQNSYFLKLNGINFAPDVAAFIKDAYLKSETPVRLDAETILPFTLTSDAASSASNRFTIIFKGHVALPVVVTDVKASAKDEIVKVEWTSRTETNVERYEIERSADAVTFTTVGNLPPTGNNATTQKYEWLDGTPNAGANFYRIKVTERSGVVTYTEIVKVNIVKSAGGISIYPNPIKGKTFSVNLKNMEKGRYTVLLYNELGQKVFSSFINHNGNNTTYPITTTNLVTKGSYKLHVTNNGFQKIEAVIFE